VERERERERERDPFIYINPAYIQYILYVDVYLYFITEREHIYLYIITERESARARNREREL
jgi:hypothetical protein